MSILKELEEKYNALIKREKSAEAYLNKSSDEQFNKWYGEFDKITRELSKLMLEYKNITGKEMSVEMILGGFKSE